MAQQVDIYDDDFSDDSFEDEKIETPSASPQQEGGRAQKHSHKEPLTVVRVDEPAPSSHSGSDNDDESVSTESDVDARSESSSSSSSRSSSSNGSTVECLSRDPLFLVLSQFLSNDKGNIVDVLCDINRNLKKIARAMSKRA